MTNCPDNEPATLTIEDDGSIRITIPEAWTDKPAGVTESAAEGDPLVPMGVVPEGAVQLSQAGSDAVMGTAAPGQTPGEVREERLAAARRSGDVSLMRAAHENPFGLTSRASRRMGFRK